MGDNFLIALRNARAFCARYYRDNKPDRMGWEHPSFLARDAIKLAGEKFGIGYGAEGFCWDCGRDGVTYLNMGDAYADTIIFDSRTEQFRIGCWGDVVECLESEGIVID